LIKAVELLGKNGAKIDAVNRHLEPPLSLTEDGIMIRMLTVWLC
jgi:hypothetical protein